MTDEAVGRALDLAQQLLLDTARALEEAARKLRDYETGSQRLVAALEAIEAERDAVEAANERLQKGRRAVLRLCDEGGGARRGFIAISDLRAALAGSGDE